MRLFIATSFPAGILDDLNGRVARFRSRLPPASWVRPESQHLTFAFLGEQPDREVDLVSPPLATTLAALPRFEAVLEGCGFFPNTRHARVGWVGLAPEEPFLRVASAVRTAVTGAGIALDSADFKSHLTLMRIREPWPPASIDLFCRSLHDYRSGPIPVDSVTLYSSRLDPKGAVHTPLRTFPLA